MKTNQIMQIELLNGILPFGHKTGYGDIKALFRIGNMIRLQKGRSILNMTNQLTAKRFGEFKTALANRIDISTDDVVKSTGKGSRTVYKAHLYAMIYLAEKLDPDFHVEVIDIFVKHKILDLRDEGGDAFTELNPTIDAYLPDREDKSGNRGIYVNVAKMIRSKIFTEEQINQHGGNDKNIWNSPVATAHHLTLRIQYEKQLITFMRMGFIKNWEHLKEVIHKL